MNSIAFYVLFLFVAMSLYIRASPANYYVCPSTVPVVFDQVNTLSLSLPTCPAQAMSRQSVFAALTSLCQESKTSALKTYHALTQLNSTKPLFALSSGMLIVFVVFCCALYLRSAAQPDPLHQSSSESKSTSLSCEAFKSLLLYSSVLGTLVVYGLAADPSNVDKLIKTTKSLSNQLPANTAPPIDLQFLVAMAVSLAASAAVFLLLRKRQKKYQKTESRIRTATREMNAIIDEIESILEDELASTNTLMESFTEPSALTENHCNSQRRKGPPDESEQVFLSPLAVNEKRDKPSRLTAQIGRFAEKRQSTVSDSIRKRKLAVQYTLQRFPNTRSKCKLFVSINKQPPKGKRIHNPATALKGFHTRGENNLDLKNAQTRASNDAIIPLTSPLLCSKGLSNCSRSDYGRAKAGYYNLHGNHQAILSHLDLHVDVPFAWNYSLPTVSIAWNYSLPTVSIAWNYSPPNDNLCLPQNSNPLQPFDLNRKSTESWIRAKWKRKAPKLMKWKRPPLHIDYCNDGNYEAESSEDGWQLDTLFSTNDCPNHCSQINQTKRGTQTFISV